MLRYVITEPDNRQTVEATDAGNTDSFKNILRTNPALVHLWQVMPGDEYFKHLCLPWFATDDDMLKLRTTGQLWLKPGKGFG